MRLKGAGEDISNLPGLPIFSSPPLIPPTPTHLSPNSPVRTPYSPIDSSIHLPPSSIYTHLLPIFVPPLACPHSLSFRDTPLLSCLIPFATFTSPPPPDTQG